MYMNIFETIINLIFPIKCELCGKIGKNYICEKCFNSINEYLYTKSEKDIFFLLRYKDLIRSKMIDFKFNDKPYLYHMFCEIFEKSKFGCDFANNYDIIIPVPMYKSKKLKRGYNQSELLARGISKIIGISICEKVLIKQKNTLMQSSLGKENRVKNVKNAYKVINLEKIQNKNVLLIDDIYTTGATVKECKNMLIQAGAKSVGTLIIAKD